METIDETLDKVDGHPAADPNPELPLSRADFMLSECLKARAKAEVAKASQDFSKREAALKKRQLELEEIETLSLAKVEHQKKEIDVDLDILKEERICAEAEAEADVFEEHLTRSHSLARSEFSGYLQTLRRTTEYVNSLPDQTPQVTAQEPRRFNLKATAQDFIPQTRVSSVISESRTQNVNSKETPVQNIDAHTQPFQSEHMNSNEFIRTEPVHLDHVKFEHVGSALLKSENHNAQSCHPKSEPDFPGQVEQSQSENARSEHTRSELVNPNMVASEDVGIEHSQNNFTRLSNYDSRYTGSNDAFCRSYLNQNVSIANSAQQNQGQTGNMNQINIGTFLMKRDLALSRLTNFNDQPEYYLSWKSTFMSVMKEAQMSAAEELDLLVKWLGPTSSQHARSIRSASTADPTSGLHALWQRLDMRYGSPEAIESALKIKLNNFQRITPQDNTRLYEFLDILDELRNIKRNPAYSVILAFYDSPVGINELVAKLPSRLQVKWTDKAANYKRSHNAIFPPLEYFVEFVAEVSSVANDPGLNVVMSDYKGKSNYNPHLNKPKSEIRVRKTGVDQNSIEPNSIKHCPIHNAPHSLNECKAFNGKNFNERKNFIKEKGICYRCGESDTHIAKRCTVKVSCSVCQGRHPTCLHQDKKSGTDHGGEHAISCRTALASNSIRSCAKIIPVRIYIDNKPTSFKKVYALLDDQSNRSLVSPELLDYFKVNSPEMEYTLSSCTGSIKASGRRASGFQLESLDGKCTMNLPTLIECSDIPNDPCEIPTPDLAGPFPHLKEAADNIFPLDPNCKVELLIGRDLIQAHHVLKQLTGGHADMPIAQKTPLGWVIVGNVSCLGKVHRPTINPDIKCFKTFLMQDGRQTIFQPCDKLREVEEPLLEADIFERTPNDEKIGWSVEDREFYSLMTAECKQDEDGFWTAPLPFRTPRKKMPNNRVLALKRAEILDKSLKRDQGKCKHFVQFMEKIFQSGAAEVAPEYHDEVWYLPLVGVYNPKKPGKIRRVFDSSAEFQGTSLNSVLMSGPNLTNNLLSVLLRFRRNKYAISSDIEQMFYRFFVNVEHSDFLHFFWYRDNNPESSLIEYRMRAHVFGNSPSPAVATFALRRAVENADDDIKQFVNNDFYVDDALTSRCSVTESVDILKRTQKALNENGHIRLHKVVSNSTEIMKVFADDDLSEDLKSIDLEYDTLPTQRSLGLMWNLNTDTFEFRVNMNEDTHTHRQMLSILNSVFDPLGFLCPFTIQGKLLLRVLTSDAPWDEIIPKEKLRNWNTWKNTMMQMSLCKFQRMFLPVSLDQADKVELHIFSDASEKAIAAVAYVKAVTNGQVYTGFTMGKAKLAPMSGNTIPRLELCAAVLAVELGEALSDALDIPVANIHFHTDSRVILGYINNRVRCFYTYVSNRGFFEIPYQNNGSTFQANRILRIRQLERQ